MNDVQAVQATAFTAGDFQCLVQCGPAGTLAADRHEDVEEQALGAMGGQVLAAPRAGRWAVGELVGRREGHHAIGDARDHAAQRASGAGGQVGGGVGWLDLPAKLVLQCGAMLRDPQVEVGLCAVREVAQDAAFADRAHDRNVDLVVPVRDGFGIRYVALLVEPHEVAMDGDVLFQHPVLSRDSHGKVCSWA